MTLEPGRQLAHYRLIEKIGEGGMGVVWRAEDTTLHREAAIKVLPAALAGDAERLVRFGREARMLAALNHPNIAAVYGLHEADGIHFLAMELVRGEDLSDRIARGPLAVDDALAIARDVAEALRVAHGSGMVHRDLKPANIRIGPGGEVKVLDFGLAKVLAADGEGSNPGSGPSLSPTVTSLGTIAGTLLGTAAYMSPEQARGRPVDKRADVWAFGCVLFEMLTGRLAFPGETITDTLAAIVRADPPWEALPAGLPPGVERVLRLCLAKDPRERLNDVADAMLLIGNGLGAPGAASADPRAPVARRTGRREALAWTLAVVALAVAGVAWIGVGDGGAAAPAPATRFTVHLDDAVPLTVAEFPIVAFSRDGRRIVFQAKNASSDGTILYLRSIDQRDPWPLAGTENAVSPFFSPDGEHVAFFAGGELKRVPVGGGAPTTLAPAPNPRGGAWLSDGTIVFSPEYVSGLQRVSESGGTVTTAIELDADAGERTFRWPSALPGHAVLFTVGYADSPNNYDDATIVAVRVDTGERRELIRGANMARFLPPDRLVYLRAGTLYAVGFDPERLAVDGDPVVVEEGVGGDPSSGAGFFDVSGAGDLVHVASSVSDARASVVLVDRDGTAETLPLEPRGYYHPRFSPDGSALAFAVGKGAIGVNGDVWVYGFAEGGMRRVTFGRSDIYPLWSPDGSRLAYVDAERSKVVAVSVDGSGNEQVLIGGETEVWLPDSWSPDGRTVAMCQTGRTTDVRLVTVGEQDTRLFASDASGAAISPDGRWIAYQSPSSGDARVYVRPLDGEGKWQVSNGRGAYARWSPDGRRLFFIAYDGAERTMTEVDVQPGDTFRFGIPRPLFPVGRFVTATAPVMNWDTDGKRFAFVELLRDEGSLQEIEVSLGWSAALPGR